MFRLEPYINSFQIVNVVKKQDNTVTKPKLNRISTSGQMLHDL